MSLNFFGISYNTEKLAFQLLRITCNFRFPTDFSVANQWKSQLGIDSKQHICGRICIQHFRKDDLITNISLAKTAIPITMENPAPKQLCDEDSDGSNESDNIHSECCKKAIEDIEKTVSNLKEINNDLMNKYESKMRVMLNQIEQYRQKMKALGANYALGTLPKPLDKNPTRTAELARKVKRLQDSVRYRNLRLDALNKNRKINDKIYIENENIAKVAEVSRIKHISIVKIEENRMIKILFLGSLIWPFF